MVAELVPHLGICNVCGNADAGEQLADLCEALNLPYWPPAGWSARRAIDNIRALVGTKSSSSECHSTGILEWDEVSDFVHELESKAAGLCLRCLREDHVDMQKCTDVAHKA